MAIHALGLELSGILICLTARTHRKYGGLSVEEEGE
jgi:hypothetical protein